MCDYRHVGKANGRVHDEHSLLLANHYVRAIYVHYKILVHLNAEFFNPIENVCFLNRSLLLLQIAVNAVKSGKNLTAAFYEFVEVFEIPLFERILRGDNH